MTEIRQSEKIKHHTLQRAVIKNQAARYITRLESSTCITHTICIMSMMSE